MTRQTNKPNKQHHPPTSGASNATNSGRVKTRSRTLPGVGFSGRQLVEFNEAVDSLEQAAIPPAEMPEMVERVFGRGQRIYGRIELDAAVFDAVLYHAETLAEESENNHGNGPTDTN